MGESILLGTYLLYNSSIHNNKASLSMFGLAQQSLVSTYE
jgi:hypothetical protein